MSHLIDRLRALSLETVSLEFTPLAAPADEAREADNTADAPDSADRDRVAPAALTVVVDRPRALNALNRTVIAELRRVVAMLRDGHDGTIRGVILSGAGDRAFVAGADIAEMRGMGPAEAAAFARDADELGEWLEDLPVPVIAAVHGFALGGGLELALAADLIIAAEAASFAQPEVGLGLIPGFGGCVRLQQWIGPARARDLILTGRRITAGEAAAMGLVSRVCPGKAEVLAAALDTIRLIATQAPTAVAAAKRTVRRVAPLATGDGLAVEQRAFAACFASDDMREGTAAFVEKRRPRFTGTAPGHTE